MARFKFTVNINQSPEITWNAYIDPQNMLQWMKNLEKVEVIKGKFGELGAIAHLHYREKGCYYILEDKLLAYKSGKLILSQVSGEGMIIKVETVFGTHPDGTCISMTWNGTSKSLIVRFILKLMRKKITNQARVELLDFKGLVEAYGAKFPDKL